MTNQVKELTAQTTALKKSVGKGAADKKKKKEVQEQIYKLEQDLKIRHEEELKAVEQNGEPVDLEVVEAQLENLSVQEEQKTNRQQKRKVRHLSQFKDDHGLHEYLG